MTATGTGSGGARMDGRTVRWSTADARVARARGLLFVEQVVIHSVFFVVYVVLFLMEARESVL